MLKKENSTLEESLCGKLKEELEQEKTNTIVQDKAKEMIERQNSEKLCRKLDTKDEIIKDRQKPKVNSTLKESLCTPCYRLQKRRKGQERKRQEKKDKKKIQRQRFALILLLVFCISTNISPISSCRGKDIIFFAKL